jgi:YHS domain-containing protein
MPQVTDPVCGMRIDSKKAAAQSEFNGNTYYFCSRECATQFDADPREFEKHEPPRTTTAGFTAPKFGSAGSGGAEYELLPEAHGKDRHKDK